MKFPSVGTDGQTDRQTYITKLIVAFRDFANAPTRLMLCSEIVPVCSEIHTKRLNKLREQNVEFMFKPGVK